MKTEKLVSGTTNNEILVIIWVLIIGVALLIYCFFGNKKVDYKKHPIIATISTFCLAIGEILCVLVMSIAGIEKGLDLLSNVFAKYVPDLEHFTINKFIVVTVASVLIEFGAVDLLSVKAGNEFTQIAKRLFSHIKYKIWLDEDVTQEEYKKESTKDIYDYYIRTQKRKNEYESKIAVSEEIRSNWFNSINGKETDVILAKILEKSNGIDGTTIQLEDSGEKRILFMTGDEYDKKCSKYSQSYANKRATQRFENMKSRGFLEGDIDRFYITLQGKEYVLEKSALDLLPPKLDSNEQSNMSEPIKQ